MEQNLKLSKVGADFIQDAVRYAETVGMLLNLITCTQPDMAFAVGKLARFMSQPREERWVGVKAVMRYQKQTEDYDIFSGGAYLLFMAFVDSHDAADPD
jgi:hypothetical protein